MNLTDCRKQLLGPNPGHAAENWLVDHVCSKDDRDATVQLARNFFLDEFSRPFLEYLSRHLYGESYRYISGPYFEFISPCGGPDFTPYYKVRCFSRQKNSKLRTYIATITARHFTARRAKEVDLEQKHTSIDSADSLKTDFFDLDLKENRWFTLLLLDESTELSLSDKFLMAKLEKAMSQLPERERRVIQLTVMDNVPGLEVFEELADQMNSKNDQSKMTPKEKQKAVAVLKFHAINHLSKLMKK